MEKMTRRTVIKATGALAASTALGGCVAGESESDAHQLEQGIFDQAQGELLAAHTFSTSIYMRPGDTLTIEGDVALSDLENVYIGAIARLSNGAPIGRVIERTPEQTIIEADRASRFVIHQLRQIG